MEGTEIKLKNEFSKIMEDLKKQLFLDEIEISENSVSIYIDNDLEFDFLRSIIREFSQMDIDIMEYSVKWEGIKLRFTILNYAD